MFRQTLRRWASIISIQPRANSMLPRLGLCRLADKLFVIQWDDPYDQNTAAILDMPALYTNFRQTTPEPRSVHGIPVSDRGPTLRMRCLRYWWQQLDAIVTIIGPGKTIVSTIRTRRSTKWFVSLRLRPVAGYSIAVDRFATTPVPSRLICIMLLALSVDRRSRRISMSSPSTPPVGMFRPAHLLRITSLPINRSS